MSLDNFDKEHYKQLKEFAADNGVGLCHKKYSDYTGNGVTIAYQPMLKTPDCRMLAVSVSYCAPEDKFRKKLGKYQVLLKFLRGEFIQVPLAYSYQVLDKEDFEDILFEMFAPADH